MTYKELKNKIKEEQKVLASLIRRGKYLRKPKNRVDQTDDEIRLYGHETHWIWYNTKSLGQDYRTTHVAYCTFFNKTPYEAIERDAKSNFDGVMYKVIIQEWEKILSEETVCSSAS